MCAPRAYRSTNTSSDSRGHPRGHPEDLGLRYLAALDARRAYMAPRDAAILGNPHALNVRQETSTGDSRRVQTDTTLAFLQAMTNNPVSSNRTLTTNITYSCHYYPSRKDELYRKPCSTSKQKGNPTYFFQNAHVR